MKCPKCQGTEVRRYGFNSMRKQRWICKNPECGHQFVEVSRQPNLFRPKWNLVDRMLAEKASTAAIVKETGISISWLWLYAEQNGFDRTEMGDVGEDDNRSLLELDLDSERSKNKALTQQLSVLQASYTNANAPVHSDNVRAESDSHSDNVRFTNWRETLLKKLVSAGISVQTIADACGASPEAIEAIVKS